MATITKLGQTFVAKTEATAASQNEQNAKIDELIDIFGKETTGNTKTIAIPFIKSNEEVKITTLGSNLSVNNNTLNASFTTPVATASAVGGAKIGNGLEMIASTSGSTSKDKLQVNVGNGLTFDPEDSNKLTINVDSSLTFTSAGKLKVTNPGGGGGITEGEATDLINTALAGYAKTSDLSAYVTKSYATLNSTGGTGKYITTISQSDGKVSATAATLPTTKVSYASGVYTVKYDETELFNINTNTNRLTITNGSNTASYILLKPGEPKYYVGNDSTITLTTIPTVNSKYTFTVSNTKAVHILLPFGQYVLTDVKDPNNISVLDDFTQNISWYKDGGVLYQVYTKYAASNINTTFTLSLL